MQEPYWWLLYGTAGGLTAVPFRTIQERRKVAVALYMGGYGPIGAGRRWLACVCQRVPFREMVAGTIDEIKAPIVLAGRVTINTLRGKERT